MTNKQTLNDETPETLGAGINQSGETYPTHLYVTLNAELYQSPLRRIERLQYVLRDVISMTYCEWVDGFLWNRQPEHRISIVECMAFVYLKAISNTKISLDEKMQVYVLICEVSCNAPSEYTEEYTDEYIEEFIEECIAGDMPKGLPSVSKIFKMYWKALEGFERP